MRLEVCLVLVLDCVFRAEVCPTGNKVVQNLIKQCSVQTEAGQKGQNKAQANHREILKAKGTKGENQTSPNGRQARSFSKVHYSAIR